MGHDEVYQIGVCKVCREKDPAELFAADVNRLYDYLKKKGLKMMIWADMLQRPERYRTTAAIDKIPKDILMLDFIWYFHFDKDLEDNLLSKGFKVAVGNLYSSHYPRYESRMAKKNMVGGQISTWVGTNEESIQQEGKFFDLYLTAHMLWNADSYSHFHTRLFDRMISARIPQLREELRQVKYPSRMAGAKTQLLLENPISFPPIAPTQKTEFAVDVPCDSLVLYHTCLRKLTRYPWTKNQVLGQYILTYSDGSQEQVDITSGGNIGWWGRRQNSILKHQTYRHNGYTAGYYADGITAKTTDGTDATVYRLEHLLPAGKQLVSVRLDADPAADGQIFLCKAEAVQA
jgi:hexosaminidase